MDRYFVPPELTLLGVERRAATQALLDATAKVRTAFESTLSLVVATLHMLQFTIQLRRCSMSSNAFLYPSSRTHALPLLLLLLLL
jgi:hypothetical protein